MPASDTEGGRAGTEAVAVTIDRAGTEGVTLVAEVMTVDGAGTEEEEAVMGSGSPLLGSNNLSMMPGTSAEAVSAIKARVKAAMDFVLTIIDIC